MNGVQLIAAERTRQIEREGYKPEHDDTHDMGELAEAACAYAGLASMQACAAISAAATDPYEGWPWTREDWKPSEDPVRNLVKSGALIAAEIDRLQRKAK